MERPWQQTACILCECNCGIEVQLDGRRLARIRGDRARIEAVATPAGAAAPGR